MFNNSSRIIYVIVTGLTFGILGGCGGSSTSSEGSEPLLSDQSEQIDVENFDTELGEQLLIERVFNSSLDALLSMNDIFSQGELTEPYISCVDSTGGFPLIEYDCSAAATQATLQEFGFPVSQLKLIDDPFCREQIVSTQESFGCVIDTLHVQFADNWQFRTQYSVSGSVVTRNIQLFQGDFSPLVDPDTFSDTACNLTQVLFPVQPTVRNDEQLCRQATLELLSQTNE